MTANIPNLPDDQFEPSNWFENNWHALHAFAFALTADNKQATDHVLKAVELFLDLEKIWNTKIRDWTSQTLRLGQLLEVIKLFVYQDRFGKWSNRNWETLLALTHTSGTEASDIITKICGRIFDFESSAESNWMQKKRANRKLTELTIPLRTFQEIEKDEERFKYMRRSISNAKKDATAPLLTPKTVKLFSNYLKTQQSELAQNSEDINIERSQNAIHDLLSGKAVAALKQLEEKYRVVLALKFWGRLELQEIQEVAFPEGKTFQEACDELGITLGAAQGRFYDGLEKMRRTLEEDEDWVRYSDQYLL